MKVISLSALTPQSGKDTLADFIESIEGLNIKRIAFGDALRDEVVSLFNGRNATFHEEELRKMIVSSSKDIDHPAFSVNQLPTSASNHCICTFNQTYRNFLGEMFKYDPVELTASRSLRFHLQHYGNNFTKGHKGLELKWIDIVVDKMTRWKEQGVDLVIVTDCRDPKEFQWLVDEFDAHTFLIKKYGFPKTRHDIVGNAHPIEQFARNFKYDWELTNVYGNEDIMKADFMNIYNNYI